ncbi:hypothetical protein ACFSSC_02785 [Corynebacterium mendelii]|nr:hypothetical protein [Corynebacterium mendelii]
MAGDCDSAAGQLTADEVDFLFEVAEEHRVSIDDAPVRVFSS